MGQDKPHPYLPKLFDQLEKSTIDRREFLRTATLLGLSAASAYAAARMVDPTSVLAQTPLPKGGRLRIGTRVHEVKDIQAINWVEASNMIRQGSDYLSRTGHDNITRPQLLEGWAASEDLKTWTLRVRKGVTFRNNKPFNAEHVAANIARVLDPKTGSGAYGLMRSYMLTDIELDEIDPKTNKKKKSTKLWDSKAIEKVDDHTVRLNLKVGALAVPEHFFHYPFVMIDPEENGVFKPGYNGMGAFELVSYEVGKRAVFTARKNYWGKSPSLETVEFIDFGSEPSPYIAAMASKQVDGLYEVDFAQLDAIKGLPHVQVYPVTSAQTGLARGKYTEKPFSDPKIRKAMKLAIDNQRVIDIVFRGNGNVAEHHHCAPVHPEYAKLPPFKQDVAQAKKLVAEAGYPNGLDLEITCKNHPAWEQAAATVLAEMWKEAGIRVKINVMPAATYWPVWDKVPFGFSTWTHRPLGVMTYGLAYRTGVPWNETGYSNPEFDKLLTEAEATLDIEKRRALMAKLETILQEDGPFVQSIWRIIQTAYDKRVKGFRMHPSQYIFAEELGVEA